MTDVAVNDPNGIVVAGGAVVLTGAWLKTARQAVLIADAARRHNGLPRSTAYIRLAEVLTAAMSTSANGHSDVRGLEEIQNYPQASPTVTVADAAQQLQCTQRHIRRNATRLGGKKIAGRWLLDQDAIHEHRKGQASGQRELPRLA
jgi:hypothetical protein